MAAYNGYGDAYYAGHDNFNDSFDDSSDEDRDAVEHVTGDSASAAKTSLFSLVAQGSIPAVERFLLRCTKDIATDIQLCNIAVQNEDIEMLRFLHGKKCTWDETTFVAALKVKDSMIRLTMLQFLMFNGLPLSDSLLIAILEHRQVDFVAFDLLWKAGCPSSEFVINTAVWNGHLDALVRLTGSGFQPDPNLCRLAVMRGHVHIMKYMNELGAQWGTDTFEAAVRTHQLESVKLLSEYGVPMNADIPVTCRSLAILDYVCTACKSPFTPNTLLKAIARDDVPAYTQDHKASSAQAIIKCLRKHGCEWSLAAMAKAVRTDDLELVRYMHEDGCPWDETIHGIAQGRNNARMINYMRAQKCPSAKMPPVDTLIRDNICRFFPPDAIVAVARDGATDVVKWMHDGGAAWDEKACAIAAANGHLETLKYMHDNGCPWDATACNQAVVRGRLNVVQYLHDNGCPWDDMTYRLAIESGNTDIITHVANHGCPWTLDDAYRAIQYDCVTAIELMYDGHHDPSVDRPEMMDMRLLVYAARRGNVDIVKHLHKYGFLMPRRAFEVAVVNNRKAVVQYLIGELQIGYERYGLDLEFMKSVTVDMFQLIQNVGWIKSRDVYVEAISCGRVDLLMYLDKDGCPRSDVSMRMAILHGQPESVEYLRSIGYTLGIEDARASARIGHVGIMDYLHDNNCPWDTSVTRQAAAFNHLAMLKYLHEKHCPRDDDECLRAARNSEIQQYVIDTKDRENKKPWSAASLSIVQRLMAHRMVESGRIGRPGSRRADFERRHPR